MPTRNKHIGSSLDAFLEEEGILTPGQKKAPKPEKNEPVSKVLSARDANGERDELRQNIASRNDDT